VGSNEMVRAKEAQSAMLVVIIAQLTVVRGKWD